MEKKIKVENLTEERALENSTPLLDAERKMTNEDLQASKEMKEIVRGALQTQKEEDPQNDRQNKQL